MTVGRPTPVVVFAILDGASASTVVVPSAASTSIVVFETASCWLSARLHGALFAIDVTEPVEKTFGDSPKIEWDWNVTPTTPEANRLTVDIFAIAKVDSRDVLFKSYPSVTQDITVKAAPVERTSLVKAALKWLGLLAAAILGTLVTQWVVYLVGPPKEPDEARTSWNLFRRWAAKREVPPPPQPPDVPL